MTVSEVISKLEQLKEFHGDLPVSIEDFDLNKLSAFVQPLKGIYVVEVDDDGEEFEVLFSNVSGKDLDNIL